MPQLILLYYILISIGIWTGGVRLLKRLEYFSVLPAYTRLLLSGLLFVTSLNWLGFFGLFRSLPWLLPASGAALAAYACYEIFKARRSYPRWIGYLTSRSCLPLAGMVFILLITFATAHWCYFVGGSNNVVIDEVRGISFTTAFAANYLKPAYQINLSVPVRYSYNFYQYTAFLYATVEGLSWPSIALWLGALVGITGFNVSFIRLTRLFIRKPSAASDLICLLMVSFWGLDILVNFKAIMKDGHIEMWNMVWQITQTSTMWNLLYHYLAAAGMGMEALVCLHHGFKQRRREYLIAAALLLGGGITCAAITGLFFCITAVLILAVYLLSSVRQKSYAWLVRQLPYILAVSAVFLTFIWLPHIFIVLGSSGYLAVTGQAKFWFSDGLIQTGNWPSWRYFLKTLWLELGFVHWVALLAAPAAAVWLFAGRRMMQASIVLGFILAIIITLCFIRGTSQDWYWRGGNFGCALLSSLLASAFFTRYLPSPQRPVRESATYWLAIFIFLLPGIYNFYAEEYLRYRECAPLSEKAPIINQLVDLHTGVGKVFSPAILSYYSGRLPVVQHNDVYEKLNGMYALNPSMRSTYFPTKTKMPCIHTWYGDSAPNGHYAELLETPEGYIATYYPCPLQEISK